MYISKFERTWAVIYTDNFGQIIVEEFATEEKANKRLAALRNK